MEILGGKFEFWQLGRGWRWGLFNFLLPSRILLKLAGVMTSDDEVMEEKLVWSSGNNGNS